MRTARSIGVAATALATLGFVAVGPATPAAASVTEVDWRNATFDVPAIGACPADRVHFTDGSADTGAGVYRFTPGQPVRYADVTGEGVTDALAVLDCGPPGSEYTSALVGLTTRADGTTIRTLGPVVVAPDWTTTIGDVTTWYGDVAVLLTGSDGDRQTRYYRWASSAQAFVRIDG